MLSSIKNEEDKMREGGGARRPSKRQHKKGRLTARRAHCAPAGSAILGEFFEQGVYAAFRNV